MYFPDWVSAAGLTFLESFMEQNQANSEWIEIKEKYVLFRSFEKLQSLHELQQRF